MKWLSRLLSENSDLSCMRAMALSALIFAFSVAVAGIYSGRDLSQIAMLCGVFIGPAFAGKVFQKNAEVKQPPQG